MKDPLRLLREYLPPLPHDLAEIRFGGRRKKSESLSEEKSTPKSERTKSRTRPQLEYTRREVKKELVLLEKHLKQAPAVEREFCIDCVEKHTEGLEGLCEEGVLFTPEEKEKELYIKCMKEAREIHEKAKTSSESELVEMAGKVRELRKQFSELERERERKELAKYA